MEAWGLICKSEGWGWLSLGVWMGNWILFFCFGYSPDFSTNMLFFHPEILSRHSLETWAVSQEFLSAKQRLWGEQQVCICGLLFSCICTQASGCQPWLDLYWEAVSWNHWDLLKPAGTGPSFPLPLQMDGWLWVSAWEISVLPAQRKTIRSHFSQG